MGSAMKTPALIVIAVLTLATTSFAVDPPPDGGYPNGNTAEGEGALFSLNVTSGSGLNTAVGYHALYSSIDGSTNTAIGAYTLENTTWGFRNTAVGYLAMASNVGGFLNTAVGEEALAFNVSGNDNTAVGQEALWQNTASFNTAVGAGALLENTDGDNNTALGSSALRLNFSGHHNTAVGSGALYVSQGSKNTAVGSNALYVNQFSTANENTAVGYNCLRNNKHGINNTAVGSNALSTNANGANNIAVGQSAGSQCNLSDNILIGHPGIQNESGAIHLGAIGTQTSTFIAGVNGTTVANGVAVMVDTNGRLGTIISSARYKDNIQPMEKSSEAILSLKPVTFHYKKALDPDAIPQFGLVAEDVAKVDPDLVARDEEGKPYTVRYDAVNAMLLNEFLKEHKTVEKQADKIQRLESALTQQAAQLQELTARLTAKGL
jgi:hypothetical protein